MTAVGRTVPSPAPASRAHGKRVDVYDMSAGVEAPLTMRGTHQSRDPIARVTYANALRADRFLRTAFGRDGWDGKGSPLKVVVHVGDGDVPLNNAFWDGTGIYFGDGDGHVLGPLGKALDVTVHETTHAVVDSEVNLRYSGQQGAINESFADVLASVADPKDWQIGEDVFTPQIPGDSIRDLSKPRYGSVAELPREPGVEVHDLSGVPSLAAVKVGDTIGRDKLGQIWYRALTDHLDSRAGFAGAARATLEAARDLYGQDSREFSAVRDAWKAVGVRTRWKP